MDQISDLKWIAVWCIKYKVLFGKLETGFGKPEAGTETDLESETESEKGKVKKVQEEGETLSDGSIFLKPYGKFSELKYGVSGLVSTTDKELKVLKIDSFNYDGKGM